MTKNVVLIIAFWSLTSSLKAQSLEKLITVKEVERIENILASDSMQGRKAFTPGIEKAADFIASEFKKIGLKPLPGEKNFRQTFIMVKPKQTELAATVNGKSFNPQHVLAITTQPELTVTEQSGYGFAKIAAGSDIGHAMEEFLSADKNTIVWVDTSFSKIFGRLGFFKRYLFKSSNNVVFIMSSEAPTTYSIAVKHNIEEVKASNIAGVLPGKAKGADYVIFSGHYDHLGIGKTVNGDSIYNGANDDASGIAAVISIAKYYAAKKENKRSLVFVAFTAEELGGYGSKYFSKQMPAEKVAAMFNIEMIGTESKWGKNSAYITGFEKTNMGDMLQKSLAGTNFNFYADPYPDQELFYRSDNATLAKLGVPAHTISTSKMDNEPNYHKVSDDVSTLDLENMTAIIRAIILSAKSIVVGKDTPTRVVGE